MMTVPTIGPVKVPRPPTTSIVTRRVIGARPIMLGDTTPNTKAYSVPAIPAKKPERPNTTIW